MDSTTESQAARGESQAVRGGVRSGFLPDRIIHLHPSRLCNLACLHCYSQSGPQQRSTMGPAPIGDALEALRAEGYEVVSLSGGEPLAYPHIGRVIGDARDLGLRVTMVTNGLLATGRRAAVLSRLDGVAISFDGLASTHDEMRGRPGAFDGACAALRQLAKRDRPVGAAISLTRDAIAQLPDLADHLVGLGTRSLQIRPVAWAGRARTLSQGSFYTAADRGRLYLVVSALRHELPGDVRVHCDLAPSQGLWRQRDAYDGLMGGASAGPGPPRPLAELVNPLVITDGGLIKPIAYDFNSRFDLGSIESLDDDRLRTYKQQGLRDLRSLIGDALADLERHHDLIDWFDHCARLSETFSRRYHADACFV